MLSKIIYPDTLEYSSDGKHLPIEFFMLAVPDCKKIDLKLGYFSSNAIRTLAYGFAQFIHNGGNLRIITNHYLSIKDKLLISDEESIPLVEEGEMKYLVENDLEGLAKIIENGDQHFFNCLKYLLKNGRLEIIPVKLKPDRLAHFKQGIFDDGTNQVYFNGSCNFTYSGLIDNGESLSIARSWGEVSEKLKVKENIESINRICEKEDSGFEYLSASQIIEVINSTGNDKDLNELIDDELNIYEKLAKHPFTEKVFTEYTTKFKEKVKEEKLKPRFPYPEGPRDYQKEAYEKWVANDYKGIFAMATGTGKTITALNCLLEEYNNTGCYRGVIIVPTFSLVDQWEKEIGKFNFKNNILKVSSKTNWREDISYIATSAKFNKKFSFIVVTTYASFHRKKFQTYFKLFPIDTLFIADEAHNLGSPMVLDVIAELKLKKRIGLSATPKRYFDESGDRKIESIFNDKPPYVYDFSMEEAINRGWLCKYEYYPHIVTLEEFELDKYKEISKKLMMFFDEHLGKYKDDPIVNALLMKRKRIIHKAVNKKNIFKQIVADEFKNKGTLKYTLIYAPEGLEPDYSEIDNYVENNEELKLIDEYTSIVSDLDKRIIIRQFTANTQNRSNLISDFSDGFTDILISMKCLDEGVDVPRTELAIFCSSTGNPRQFIQRRGRVLRTHIDKDIAIIHDLIVIPRLENSTSITFSMERNIVKTELDRVANFSMLANNKYYSIEKLKFICEHYNLNLFETDNN